MRDSLLVLGTSVGHRNDCLTALASLFEVSLGPTLSTVKSPSPSPLVSLITFYSSYFFRLLFYSLCVIYVLIFVFVCVYSLKLHPRKWYDHVFFFVHVLGVLRAFLVFSRHYINDDSLAIEYTNEQEYSVGARTDI